MLEPLKGPHHNVALCSVVLAVAFATHFFTRAFGPDADSTGMLGALRSLAMVGPRYLPPLSADSRPFTHPTRYATRKCVGIGGENEVIVRQFFYAVAA
jgi:hypothetical protein